jgi:hypothetical protein
MAIGSPSGINYQAFGSYGGTLYALDNTSANPNLYSINPSTGAATLIGPTNTGQPLAGFWAISTNSTALYYSINSGLYTLNTSTGKATAVGGLGGGIAGVNAIQVGAMAEIGGVLYGGQDNSRPLTIVTVNKSTGVATVLSNVTNSPGSNASGLYGLAPIIPPQISANILPQFCFGDGWYSAVYFTNVTGTAVSFPVSFLSDAGTPLIVPAVGGSATNVRLGPHGTAIIEAPNVGSLLQGYAEFPLPSGVVGYGIIRQSVPDLPDQEAVVPFSDAGASSNMLTWDETTFTTTVVIVNPSSTAATVTVTLWDTGGNIIGTSSILLPPNGKTEAVLQTLPGLGGMAGLQGSAQFTAPGNVAVLGLRSNGSAFASLPATKLQ